MSEILDITEKYLSDDNIIQKDYHSYIPYIQSYKNNDEIRFTIQNELIILRVPMTEKFVIQQTIMKSYH